MLNGRDIQDIALEIDATSSRKRDFIVPSNRLSLSEDFRIRAFGKIFADAPGSGSMTSFETTPFFRDQLGDKLRIPRAYMRRLEQDAPSLLSCNVNHWLFTEPKMRMIRTLDPTPLPHPRTPALRDDPLPVARAFLSDQYKRRDNDMLMNQLYPFLCGTDVNGIVKSADLNPVHFHMKVLNPEKHVALKVDDPVQIGVYIRNSEVGFSRLVIEPFVYRLACSNGMIVSDKAFGGISQVHLGKRQSEGELGRFYSEETIEAEDRAFFLKCRDVIKAILSPEFETRIIERLRAADEVRIPSFDDAVELAQKRLSLTDQEVNGVKTHLVSGFDVVPSLRQDRGVCSVWELVNAVTATAHDENFVSSYGRGTELERGSWGLIESGDEYRPANLDPATAAVPDAL